MTTGAYGKWRFCNLHTSTSDRSGCAGRGGGREDSVACYVYYYQYCCYYCVTHFVRSRPFLAPRGQLVTLTQNLGGIPNTFKIIFFEHDICKYFIRRKTGAGGNIFFFKLWSFFFFLGSFLYLHHSVSRKHFLFFYWHPTERIFRSTVAVSVMFLSYIYIYW